MPSHHRFADIALVHPESAEVWIGTQNAMPFGAVAAVYAWDRMGAAVTAILRRLFCFPVLRYVDDLFSVDRPESVAHSLECLARLVRAIMGPDAMKPKKMSFGVPLYSGGI